MGKRVAVLSPEGQFGTVDETDAAAVERAGGRVLSAKETATIEAEQRQEARAEKAGVAGKIQTAVGAVGGALNPLMFTGGAGSAGEAYNAGVQQGMTAGLSDVAVRKALDATAGRQAGDAYAQQVQDVKLTGGGAHTAGEMAGLIAGSALPLTPAGAINAAGNVAERGAARILAGAAERGALGRALATGGELAARGAVEGTLLGAAQGASEAMLGDPDVTADKLWAATGHGALQGGAYGAAGGLLLGGAGSLAKSAAVGTAQAARSGLARALSRAETKVAEGTEALQGAGQAAAKDIAATPGVRDMMARPNDAARKLSNELAFDALGATKVQSRKALERVAGGADAVGEYVNRVAIKPAAGEGGAIAGAFKAGATGRADEILSAIKADKYGRVAEGLGNAVKGTDARVSIGELKTLIDETHGAMLKDPTRIAGAEAFRGRIATELSALENAGKVAADGTVDAADMFYTRAALERGAYEVGKSSGAAGEAYKGFLRDLDRKIVDTIDAAAAKAGKAGRGDEIRFWKREYQLASAAEQAAEGGSERVLRNNVFGIREAIGGLAGIATGHPVIGLATVVGGKIARERGAAAGAALLGRMADLGTLSKVVRDVDDQIAKASLGLLAAPAKRALPEVPVGSPRARAEKAAAEVLKWQADPGAFAERVARQTETMSATAPELAGGLSKRMTDGLSFLASKMPSGPPPDPLDPKPAPKMTDQEAAKFARYAWYVEKPARFFDEVAHGKLTFEGIETARTLMPGAFAELQARTAEGLATLAAQGRKPPFQQRAALGSLLGFPAVPSQRPDHAAFLQANAAAIGITQGAPPKKGGTPSRSISTSSALDRLEEGGVGRR